MLENLFSFLLHDRGKERHCSSCQGLYTSDYRLSSQTNLHKTVSVLEKGLATPVNILR